VAPSLTTISHDEATEMLAEHLAPVFEASPDGLYVWLDEEHWICSRRFAELLGYGSPEELNGTPHLLQRWIHEDDQGVFSWSYWNRVQTMAFPTTLRFRGKRKDGSEALFETEMIPLSFGGHTFAYHFVRVVG
jgi:PAS domain S-box-containing protein